MGEHSNAGMTLEDALDALMAYDHGATDSGVSDPRLKRKTLELLRSLGDGERRRALAVFARRYLTDEAIGRGCGLEDVRRAIDWLDDEMGGT